MGLLKYLCPVQVTQIGEDFDISLSHVCIEREKLLSRSSKFSQYLL